MSPREHRNRSDAPCAPQLPPSAEAERSGDLAAHSEPFALSPEAAGVPWMPEAEPFAAKR